MRKNLVLKWSKMIALGLIAGGSSAYAVPLPDRITPCPTNPTYEAHHWNLLYGGPQTLYFSVTPTGGGGIAYTQIEFSEFKDVCPRWRWASLAAKYETMEKIPSSFVISTVAVSGTGSNSSNAAWTPWYNTDRPGGNGDYQTIKGLIEKGMACSEPVDIQCRDANSKVDWTQTGENITCDTVNGGSCVNRLQPDGRCNDYEVRFSCPK